MDCKITCVADTGSLIGEGAIWDSLDACLWWVDIPAGLIHRFEPATGENATLEFGEPVGCLAVRETGGLVVAAASGFWFFDPETGAREHIHNPEPDRPESRFNDGAVDGQGRLWAGTMANVPTEPVGAVYCLSPDLTVRKWRDGMHTPNGMAFSPDCDIFYLSDSFPDVRRVWRARYDARTGTPQDFTPFFETEGLPGRPDGATVDADGCYWLAGVSGWQIYRISPDGRLIGTIDVPVEKPSRPAFGGPGMTTLYVSSISEGITPGTDQPQAGGLFAIEGLGVTGLPHPRFAG
jgi:sugar lactone lactonase YvrE